MKRTLLALVAVSAWAQTTAYFAGGMTREGAKNYCGVDSGSGSTYVCNNAAGATITAYQTGNTYWFKATHANTGSATLSIDGVVATIKKYGGSANLTSGAISSGQMVHVAYDGTNLQQIP